MYNVELINGTLHLFAGKTEVITHSRENPAFFLGYGEETIKMYCGNFDISDRVSERIALRLKSADREKLVFEHPDLEGEYTVYLFENDGLLHLNGTCGDERFNRLFIRLKAEKGEHVTGGGEQFSCLDLRGKLFPIWTREQGVGRNKLTEITRLSDESDHAGGDYHTTFFPMPYYISSRMYFMHLENYHYSELDFRAESFHELVVWNTDVSVVLCAGENYRELLGQLAKLLGTQPMLPDWAMQGICLGVQGGTDRALEMLRKCREGGIDMPSVWIQDWEGKRITSFGKRLQWDWHWNPEMYPGLDKEIEKGECLWLGYANPYLVRGGMLYEEAKAKDLFVKTTDGEDYVFDFGEFECTVVDLTSPDGFAWYRDNVVKKHLIDFGLKGWMADFGEYLPADAVCYGGKGIDVHNQWPALWAKVNYEAVEKSGKLGECMYFMRAGAAGSQHDAALIWAGDQNVDWSVDDGLPSVITAALTVGMSGCGLHSSDCGGYTTLFYLHREEELLLRWLEFSCFTPVIRTHEGNRPDSNIQLYSNDNIISFAARISKMHTALLPYMRECAKTYCETGIPVMRPLFLDNPDCDRAYERDNFSYMLGDDVLVAPVVEQGVDKRTAWLPEGDWVHLWSGKHFAGGDVTVNAPLGYTPVFIKSGSACMELFESLRQF